MLSTERSQPILRLVPETPEDDWGSQPSPAPEVLVEMEEKIREWLGSEHLHGCSGLRAAFFDVLEVLNEFLGPYLHDASEGVREFLRMVADAQPPAPQPLHLVPDQPEGTGAHPDVVPEAVSWGAGEFVRLAEIAAKVTPLQPRHS